jgi:MoxR-like ATPase
MTATQSAAAARKMAAEFKQTHDAIKAQIQRVMVGQEDVIEGVLTALLAGGHVLLEGVPGLGKTLLISSLGRAVHLSFSRIQFTPDMMPADIIGTQVLIEGEGGKTEVRFQEGPLVSNVILADEINRATPKTQSAMLQAMQERQISIGRKTIDLAEPYCVMATQNPVEQEGTYPLPEAQLDRFLFKLTVGYPAEGEYRGLQRRGDHEAAQGRARGARAATRPGPCHPAHHGDPTRQRLRAGDHQRVGRPGIQPARRAGALARRQGEGAARRALRRQHAGRA